MFSQWPNTFLQKSTSAISATKPHGNISERERWAKKREARKREGLAFNNFSGVLPQDFLKSWEAMKVKSHFDHLQYPFLSSINLYCQDNS